MNRIIFTGGKVFDGTGAPPVPADLVVRGDRIESVRVGGGTPAEAGDQVVDCAGTTVMPGLVESHCHLTFPSAVGHIDPSFNPPLDVSFFHHMPSPEEHLAIAACSAMNSRTPSGPVFFGRGPSGPICTGWLSRSKDAARSRGPGTSPAAIADRSRTSVGTGVSEPAE